MDIPNWLLNLINSKTRFNSVQKKKSISIYKKKPLQVGLYKIEFRIREIRISSKTNLKEAFLSSTWTQEIKQQ